MSTQTKIYVAGHRGMVGSAIVRALQQAGQANIVTRTHAELDLTDQVAVRRFFAMEQPDQVYLAAAKVGGNHANNTYPADFIYQNLMIEANVIEAAFRNGVKRLLFLGSSCIYPRLAAQPMEESALLTGLLEPTNEPYAIAKIAGIKLCESYNRQYGASHGVDYRSVMPTNLYGPGDNFNLAGGHVLPALLRKAHEAKTAGAQEIGIWGSGKPRREFLHVDDCADALVYLMKNYSGEDHINVGVGEDITILDLTRMVCETVGFKGAIRTDTSKPDGTPARLMSNEKLMSLGWQSKIGLREGISDTYRWYLDNINNVRGA